MAYARYLERADADRHRDLITDYRADAELILAALSAKYDRPTEELLAELAPEVERRWQREYR